MNKKLIAIILLSLVLVLCTGIAWAEDGNMLMRGETYNFENKYDVTFQNIYHPPVTGSTHEPVILVFDVLNLTIENVKISEVFQISAEYNGYIIEGTYIGMDGATIDVLTQKTLAYQLDLPNMLYNNRTMQQEVKYHVQIEGEVFLVGNEYLIDVEEKQNLADRIYMEGYYTYSPAAGFHPSGGRTYYVDATGILWGCGHNYSGSKWRPLVNSEEDIVTEFIPCMMDVKSVLCSTSWPEYYILQRMNNIFVVWGDTNYNFEFNNSVSGVQTKINIGENIHTIITENVYIDEEMGLYVLDDSIDDANVDYGRWNEKPKKTFMLGDVVDCQYSDGFSSNIDLFGGKFYIALDKNGNVYTWGKNMSGQLGNGQNEEKESPVCIMGDAWYISAGTAHGAVIKKDGSLWMWGNNSQGQLGDGTYTSRNKPVKVLNNVVYVDCECDHTLAICADGSLYSWGDNCCGQLGDRSTKKRNLPLKVLDSVKAVKAGEIFTFAVQEDGSVYAWGDNSFGQFGNGTLESSTVPVFIGIWTNFNRIGLQ